jgi:hypothetical protein
MIKKEKFYFKKLFILIKNVKIKKFYRKIKEKIIVIEIE